MHIFPSYRRRRAGLLLWGEPSEVGLPLPIQSGGPTVTADAGDLPQKAHMPACTALKCTASWQSITVVFRRCLPQMSAHSGNLRTSGVHSTATLDAPLIPLKSWMCWRFPSAQDYLPVRLPVVAIMGNGQATSIRGSL